MPARQPASPRLALLVDHDDDTRTMYAQYLRLADCDIDEASDGRDALAKALSRRHDIVITETRLPGIDGYELCNILKHDALTRSIPIVIVTADAYPPHVEHARKAGADTVLIKPCLPETLLGEIRRLLDKSHALQARSTQVRTKVAEQLSKSEALRERSDADRKRSMASRHDRHETTAPLLKPPALICPQCDNPLIYRRSNVGGVSARHSEQWDYYECPAGCGSFQYRQRTRRLRRA